ncbi:MAG: cobalamin-dependent protein [Candidatus Omnitrophica bacterium]|nr:cobalamin-dependent protein [Candidatus Omnitrophota bacterium]
MFNKVLLINPPESSQGRSTAAPMGLMYIAGVLQKAGVAVRILDACLDGWDSVVSALNDFHPDLVGIACPTYARVQAFKIARMVKSCDVRIKTILGGHHPTLMPRQILEHYPEVDLVCSGEGEALILELCQGVPLVDILGLGFRRDQEVILNARRKQCVNLDDLPMPAWNLIEPRRYTTNSEVVVDGIDLSKEIGANITFSRGCIGRCSFCSNYQMWKEWKYRSPKNTVDEIEYLYRNYGIKCFQFNDDCFSVNKKAALELCRIILERGLKIYFCCVTRTDCVDYEILRALKDAGCYSICFGIETASARLLKTMHKPIKIEQSLEAIRLVNEFGIRSVALIIAGSPGESWETINETIDFLVRAKPGAIGVANGLMLFPGTEVYRQAVKKGFINDDFWLTDYNWKVDTSENSRLRLNIFVEAINARRKLSRFFVLNMFRYHKFATKEVEIFVKDLLLRLGLRGEKIRKYKPKLGN